MRRACDPLAWPALACALLLCAPAPCAAGESGICSSMDIRNNADQIKRLQGCRVIEGQLSIVLLERAEEKDFQNVSFPELREITDYLVVYRTKGLTSLGTLFPNLAVIRGMQLFKDYALVVFDNELSTLGLRSLVKIERGGVRIEQNDRLCYINTIDWSRITPKDASNVIRLNYDTRLCGLCPNAQSRIEDHRQLNVLCPADSYGRWLCWDSKNCQKVCPTECHDNGCMDNRTCCHKHCLGGCSGPTAGDCFVCRNYTFTGGAHPVCTEDCPAGTYKFARRCVTQEQCRKAQPPPTLPDHDRRRDANKATINAYKIFRDRCVFICPAGFMEDGSTNNATCVPCPASGCVKHCTGGKVDSVAAAEQYRGCTHIHGKLEINIRGSAANTLAVLEDSLGEIREINGSLQVSRAYPLVSLMFLKNLKRIVGTGAPQFKVLQVFNNPNLELLWDWSTRNISISGGVLFINFNPKLCYNRILPLKNMTSDPVSNFTEIEVSQDSNGDQASCWPDELVLQVSQLRSTVVLLTWNNYCPDDMRKLLGYSLYYISTESNVTLYGQRDACFDMWNALDLTSDEARGNATKSDDDSMDPGSKNDILQNPCKDMQPSFHPITQLTPYTRYAAYVKTYTTLQEKKGAQSPIIYFRTLPGRPSPPLSLNVAPLSADTVSVTWSPPAMPNGTIEFYHVEILENSYNRPKILEGNTNYCANPNAISNKITARFDEVTPKPQEEKTGSVPNGTCACTAEEELKPSLKFNYRAEEERMESIYFENELQNQVYRKTEKARTKPQKRLKRSVDNSLSSMLVQLARSSGPQPGWSYRNETDDKGYVKSFFYRLGSTSLNVTGMRHFTWYTVNIWACRSKHENESMADYDAKWCSDRTFQTFRTPELTNADSVANVRAEIVPSNKTFPEVNVTWETPGNPNGFVVAYSVHYSRVDDSTQGTDVGLQSCITAGEHDNRVLSYTLRNMQSGNYSVKVTPITVAGAGNSSTPVFVYIRERTAEIGHEWIWGLVGGCVIMLLVLGGGVWYAKRGLLSGAEANKLFATVNPEYVSTVYVPDEWEVPRANIEFIKELGQGSFGMVYEGLGKNIEKGKPETRCAIKTVNEHATDRERQEFLNEASVMKAFDTFHVVRLLGVVSRGQPTLVIMELMECGDLKTYLRSHRPDADSSIPKKGPNDAPPTLQNILQMSIEIADGMAYLAAKKFVHRDLAARNCMVAGDLTVKVGDFGMTRDIYETDYYRKGTKGLLPVRWMSPESLKDGVFSSSSDVWSFGVVLWEMATLAMQPYQGLSNEQVVRYVVEGGVMERPEHCPDRLYELMRACWAHRPQQRPSFLQLVADLAPSAQPYFRHRSFFHTPQGKEMYALQRTAMDEEQEAPVNVGAVATGSGDLFGVSGRLASWVRELASLRSRTSDDAAAEPLQPLRRSRPDIKPTPNGGPPPASSPPPAPC